MSSTFNPLIGTRDSRPRKTLMEWVLGKFARREETQDEQFLRDLTDQFARGHDTAETLTWYQRSAEEGDAWAQLRLGHAYQQGNGVEQNEAEALKWYRRAVAQGQYFLGVRYTQGIGVKRDYGQTVRWYTLAASQGHAQAQVNLGSMYCNGFGVTQNHAEAVKWYRLAADQGDVIAQYNLAVSHLKGRGVTQDCLQAYMWFCRSAEGGDQQAMESRDRLAANMTATQMDQVQKMAYLFVNTDRLAL